MLCEWGRWLRPLLVWYSSRRCWGWRQTRQDCRSIPRRQDRLTRKPRCRHEKTPQHLVNWVELVNIRTVEPELKFCLILNYLFVNSSTRTSSWASSFRVERSPEIMASSRLAWHTSGILTVGDFQFENKVVQTCQTLEATLSWSSMVKTPGKRKVKFCDFWSFQKTLLHHELCKLASQIKTETQYSVVV